MLSKELYHDIFKYIERMNLKKYIFISKTICSVIVEIYKMYPHNLGTHTTEEISIQIKEYNKRCDYWNSLSNDKKDELGKVLLFNPYEPDQEY